MQNFLECIQDFLPTKKVSQKSGNKIYSNGRSNGKELKGIIPQNQRTSGINTFDCQSLPEVRGRDDIITFLVKLENSFVSC